MLSINDLKKDTLFVFNNAPCKVLEVAHKKMARQGATCEVKLHNLTTGDILTKTFFPSHKFEEAEIETKECLFLYNHQDKYYFCDPQDKSQRFFLEDNIIKESKKYLISNLVVNAMWYQGKVINIELPVKVDVKVVDAPPNVKGNSASSPTKQVIIETGATIQTPIFIQTGDTIRVNTQKGEYTERIHKA